MTYDSILVALADPSRRAIFERLTHAPSSVGVLAQEMPISRPAVSQHVKVLCDSGLLAVETRGTQRIYTATPAGLSPLRDYIDTLWTDALSSFAAAAAKIAGDQNDHDS